MVKFSARKPMTIFVAIVVVIIFGVISFTRMVPDLFPNMDFPYVVVMTPYPGAAPEEVESEVTRPTEQSLATLDNLKTINSTSSGNSSMVIMEFENGTNMDSIMVDILEKTQALSDSWSDSVGTPYIMKINPNMIPISFAAVDMEDMDRYELSEFAANTLIPALEGTTGVASVSTSGLLEQAVEINLSEEKLSDVSDKIAQSINSELGEAKKELDDSQKTINDTKAELEDSKTELESAQSQAAAGIGQGSVQAQNALSAYQAYTAQLTASKASKTALETERDMLQALINDPSGSMGKIDEGLATIVATRSSIAALISAPIPDDTALSSVITNQTILASLTAQGCSTVGDVRALDKTLEAQSQELQAQKAAMQTQLQTAPERINQIEAQLSTLDSEIMVLQGIVDEYKKNISAAEDGYTATQEGLLNSAVTFSTALSQINSAQAELDTAQAQLDAAYEAYDEQSEAALEAADLADKLTMSAVSALIGAQNFDMPAGYVYDGEISYIVSVGEGVETIDELRELVLIDTGIENMAPVTLSDVAEINVTDNADSIYASINGNEGLILIFSKQASYATASVSDNLNAEFDALEEKHPGLHFTNLMDQGEYIYMLTDSILSSLMLGALFAIIVLFIFLRDWRPTLITLISIPVSVMFAIALMYFSGVSLNIMSLSGLAIAVGMLVDNSIVVIENTYRLRALGESPMKAAVSGAAQVAGAITASTITTICVFLPIMFTDGITKQLFTDMALTLAYSLLASLIIALTLVPAMAGMLLTKKKEEKEGLFSRLVPKYKKIVSWAVDHKAVVLISCVALLIASVCLVLSRGFAFLPNVDSGTVQVTVTVDEDATFAETTKTADLVMERIMSVEGVDTAGGMMYDSSSGTSGLSLGGSEGGVTVYVILDEDTKRSGKEVSDDILAACADLDCEVDASSNSMMTSYTSLLSGTGITINVYSSDLENLQESATLLADALSEVDGVTEVSNGIEDPSPEINFTVDKEKAMEHGLTVAQVYEKVATALQTSASVMELTEDGLTYDVTVYGTEKTATPDYIKTLTFTATKPDGTEEEVALKDIASFEISQTLSTISRSEQRRYLSVTGLIAEGKNVTLVTSEAEKALADVTLPSDVKYEFAGENEMIMETMSDLILLMVIGIALVYLVMVAQFQSLKSPFIVMFTIPLAFTGGFIALFIAGMTLDITSMLGLIMLVGIIVNNGIVLVDYINNLRISGMERREAILDAAVTRLRPILMTSITTILGLAVIALGLDESSAIMQPLAVTCIGGLIYATLMTLIVIPIIYDAMSKKEPRKVDEADLELSQL